MKGEREGGKGGVEGRVFVGYGHLGNENLGERETIIITAYSRKRTTRYGFRWPG